MPCDECKIKEVPIKDVGLNYKIVIPCEKCLEKFNFEHEEYLSSK